MKAMIFAAGLGTRLRPLTDTVPKALMDVGGKPALQHVIERLKAAGITEMVVNVHHFPDKIIGFLRDNGNFGVDIRVSDERDLLLDTGGGLLKALPLLGADEPVLLHNADIVSDFPISDMISAHEATGADATLLVADRPSSRRLLFDASGRMQCWKNMTTGEVRPAGCDVTGLVPLAFGGVHIVSPTLFPLLHDYGSRSGKVFSITPFYVDACCISDLQAFIPSAPYRWFDIGRPESLRVASASFAGE